MDARTKPSALDTAAAKVAALLNPRNIVILGATDRPGNWPQRVWRNLARYGFAGPVYPLNPNRDRVWDTRCYKSFTELPQKPDHVVVLIPAAFVPDALQQAAAAGARSATIMTSGFSEASDAASQKLAARLARVIEETGLAVSGPNCLGNLNAAASLMTMPDDRPQVLEDGPVAIVGQSGGLAMAIKRTLEERGVNSSCVVTSGNEAGLTTADYISYFAGRPETRVIVSYLESVKDAGAFLAACRAARAAGKPVVVVKLGASEDGRAAALAHTGALAGSMEAFDAVAGAAGALRVRTLDDVVEAVEFFAHASLPRGKGLGGITFSGGLRGLLLDAAAANGLRFVTLAPKTLQRLEKLLTVGTIIGNPLDSGFAALTSADAYINCVDAILRDPGVDVLLLQEELPRGPGTERKETNLRAVNELAARVGKPVSFVTMISHGLTDYSRTLRADLPHVAFLQEVDKSLRAVRSVTDYAERARARPRKPARSVPASARTRLDALLTRRAAGPRTLSEVESKALLKAYGIACPKEGLATSAREAVEIATRIGFPVVAKAVSAALPHKSDAGGVLLGLQSAKAVRDAYTEITAKLGKRTALDGVLIAEMVSDGLELVLGVNRDPEVGPVILFGTGGVDLELTRDVALAPPPLDEAAAEALIARTRAGKLVAGYRGRPALDRKALVKALLGLSQLVMDAGERIDSIDINPFLLRRRGGVALDGLVVLGKAR
jgi:acyl-CoA synthetase (NDP forming)